MVFVYLRSKAQCTWPKTNFAHYEIYSYVCSVLLSQRHTKSSHSGILLISEKGIRESCIVNIKEFNEVRMMPKSTNQYWRHYGELYTGCITKLILDIRNRVLYIYFFPFKPPIAFLFQ